MSLNTVRLVAVVKELNTVKSNIWRLYQDRLCYLLHVSHVIMYSDYYVLSEGGYDGVRNMKQILKRVFVCAQCVA